jgi:hypothetical protein
VLEILHIDPGTVALCVDDDRGRRFRDSGRADHLDVQEPTVLGKHEQFRQRPFIATERPVICGYRRFEQMCQERVVRGLLTRRTSVAAKSLLGQATDLFDLIGKDDLVEPLSFPVIRTLTLKSSRPWGRPQAGTGTAGT